MNIMLRFVSRVFSWVRCYCLIELNQLYEQLLHDLSIATAFPACAFTLPAFLRLDLKTTAVLQSPVMESVV